MGEERPETLTTDRLDRQLIHALVVDGRASFRGLAGVLGSSEQTIARRYRRLREAGAIRVVVLPNPQRFAHYWIVRVRVSPPAAVAFAQAVARRPDVAWVGLISGGTEVSFVAHARTEQQRDRLLLERLPRSTKVLDLTAAAVPASPAGRRPNGRRWRTRSTRRRSMPCRPDLVTTAPQSSPPSKMSRCSRCWRATDAPAMRSWPPKPATPRPVSPAVWTRCCRAAR